MIKKRNQTEKEWKLSLPLKQSLKDYYNLLNNICNTHGTFKIGNLKFI